jgi:nucleolar protein 4
MPLEIDEKELKRLALDAGKRITGDRVRILQSKVVRAKDRVGPDGKPRSRGFGFLQFETHEAASAVIEALNNSAGPFGPTKRPILMFAWEDAQAIRKQLRRREQTGIRAKHAVSAETTSDMSAKFDSTKSAKRTASEALGPTASKTQKKIKVKLVDGFPTTLSNTREPSAEQKRRIVTEGNRQPTQVKREKGAKNGREAAKRRDQSAPSGLLQVRLPPH